MTTITTVGLVPLPPSVHHTTTRLTHREAHTLLSSFLEKSENYAAYRPDSTLSERGPQASAGVSTDASGAGGSSNLTLHHLRHILLGMEGKRVGGVAFENGLFGRRKQGNTSNKRKRDHETGLDAALDQGEASSFQSRGRGKNPALQIDEEEGWQDKEVFEQEDDVYVDGHEPGTKIGRNNPTDRRNLDPGDGDLSMENDRHPGADLPQPYTADEERELVEVEISGTGKKVDPREQASGSTVNGKSAVDKEEKKKLKRLRMKKEQQVKYKEREKKNQNAD